MPTELESDPLLNIVLYGIYHPQHYHSYCHTITASKGIWSALTSSWGQYCAICSEKIYPLVSSPPVICLRCGEICHRNCINKSRDSCSTDKTFNSTNFCPLFTFEDLEEQEMNTSDTNTNTPISASKRTSLEAAFQLRLDQIIEKAIMIPSVLGYMPEVKSQYCIWRSVLRAVALRQVTPIHQSAPNFALSSDKRDNTLSPGNDRPNPNKDIEMDMAIIENTVRVCLEDLEGFPGQVALVCCYVFLSLSGFKTLLQLTQHARECIDTVTNAILCGCPEEVIKNQRLVRMVSASVDRVILGRNESAMYEKIFRPIAKHAKSVAIRETLQVKDRPDWDEYAWKQIDELTAGIVGKRAPKEKLMILVILLQVLTRRQHVPETTKPATASATDADLAASTVDESLSAEDAEVNSKQEESDADTPTEAQSMRSSSTPNASANTIDASMNADRLLELLGLVIVDHAKRGFCDWIAQYLYLSSAVVSNDVVDTLAAEGYALATLQQCIELVVKPRQRASVAVADVPSSPAISPVPILTNGKSKPAVSAGAGAGAGAGSINSPSIQPISNEALLES